MLPSIAGSLLCLLALTYVLSRKNFLRHKRSIRDLRPIRTAAVIVYSFLLVLHVSCLLFTHSSLYCDVAALLTLVATGAFGVYIAERRIPAATVAQHRRVLAIGAHPDDLELACGGTLAKLVDAGHDVRGIVMSGGNHGGNKALRVIEAERGADFLGLTDLQVMDYPDTQLDSMSASMIETIEAVVRSFQPDIILTHSANDQHQDHYAVHQATIRAARFHHSILCYESPSTTRDFNPSIFVDISNYVDVKVEAVMTHRDQSGKPYMTASRVRGMAAFRGSQAKNAHSEAFEPVRLLGSAVGDL